LNTYTKIIGITGHYYAREQVKIKHHKNRIREIEERTVIKAFKAGKAQILVIFEETGKEIMIDDFSDPEDIKKYLGKKFLK